MRLGVAIVAVAAFLGSAPARALDLDGIRARGELTWGGDLQGGEPYVFEDTDQPGQIRGFEVDIAAALAGRLGSRRVSCRPTGRAWCRASSAATST